MGDEEDEGELLTVAQLLGWVGFEVMVESVDEVVEQGRKFVWYAVPHAPWQVLVHGA